MPSSLRASLLLAALLGAGCSAPVADDVADANGGMTEGVLVVESVVSGDGAPLTNVSAKFMHLSGSANSELAERVIGARLDLPAFDECIAVLPGVSAPAASLAALGQIELLVVGDVTLRTGSSSMPLAARAFADVGDLVSGVFYTSRDAESDLPAGATYVLESTGSAMVDRFTVEATAPAALQDVRVGEAALLEGVALEAGVAATIRWKAPGSDGAAQRGDLVLVEVSADGAATARCAFADDGEAVVPASALRFEASGTAPDAARLPRSATVSVRRIRQRAFGVSGFDTGEVRFDLAVVGRATVNPRAL